MNSNRNKRTQNNTYNDTIINKDNTEQNIKLKHIKQWTSTKQNKQHNTSKNKTNKSKLKQKQNKTNTDTQEQQQTQSNTETKHIQTQSKHNK